MCPPYAHTAEVAALRVRGRLEAAALTQTASSSSEAADGASEFDEEMLEMPPDEQLCEELDAGEGGADGCRLCAHHAGAHQIQPRRRKRDRAVDAPMAA